MSKAKESGTDPFLALLDWRNTQSEQTNQSPVQIMYGRRTRTLLPSAEALLMTPNATSAQTALTKAKQKQALYYNRGVKERPTIAVGQTVHARFDENEWRKAEVSPYSHTAHRSTIRRRIYSPANVATRTIFIGATDRHQIRT
jgi:hypothetical protein